MTPPKTPLAWLFGRRRDRLQIAIIVNQLATPGLGSWFAGHRIAGAGQMIVACAGFGLYVVYFVRLMASFWERTGLGIEPETPPARLWQWALILFGLAWLWAGVTSLQLAAELRRQRRAPHQPSSLPPRLD